MGRSRLRLGVAAGIVLATAVLGSPAAGAAPASPLSTTAAPSRSLSPSSRSAGTRVVTASHDLRVGSLVAVGEPGSAPAPLVAHASGSLPICPTDPVTGQATTIPVVDAVTPPFGPVTGNQTITITGTNFTGCETVTQTATYQAGTAPSPTSAGTPDQVTVSTSVTTYTFSVYGVTLTSTGTPAVSEGTQGTPANVTNTSMTVVTPPGPPCSPTTAMKVIINATATSATFTYTSIWYGLVGENLGNPSLSPSILPPPFPQNPPNINWPNVPLPITCDNFGTIIVPTAPPPAKPPGCTNGKPGTPTTSTTQSQPATPPITFTYQNEGSQPIACSSGGTPYDLANGNAVTTQMSNELFGDLNAERANFSSLNPSTPLGTLAIDPTLETVAEYWANQQANGSAGASASATASVTSTDGCILQEVAASGFGSTGGKPPSLLWAAENGGAFAGPASTGQMSQIFTSDTTPENTTTVSISSGGGGGSGGIPGSCPLGGGVLAPPSSGGSGGSGTSGGSGGSGTGSSISTYSTAHNIFSTTYTSVGVAVACTGANDGSCYVAEVFGGVNTQVQPDCADITPANPAPDCPKPTITGGGTQALDVLPGPPENVTASLTAVPGGGYEITVTWSPPAAGGYDPVNMYAVADTDTYTGQPCSEDVGPAVLATSWTGCTNGTNTTMVTTDEYTIQVRAVNDLCQQNCAPAYLYPPPVAPGTGSNCTRYGTPGYPNCSPDSSSPDGPWQAATPYPVVWVGPNCNPNTVTSNGQCNPPQHQAGLGYRLVASDGGVFTYGGDNFYGSVGGKAPDVRGETRIDWWSSGSQCPGDQMMGIASTPDGGGYWTVASDGGVFTFGDAPFFGSRGGISPSTDPNACDVAGMVVTPDGQGYWLFDLDGNVYPFGDAAFKSDPAKTSACGETLSGDTIVSMAVTPDGGGYWLATGSGKVFAYGDAGCLGDSYGFTSDAKCGPTGTELCPTVGITPTADGKGYWLADANGWVYPFGDATSYGNAFGSYAACVFPVGVGNPGGGNLVVAGTTAPCTTIIGIWATQDGKGYWMLTAAGGIITYGDATFSGSPSSLSLLAPIVSMEVG